MINYKSPFTIASYLDHEVILSKKELIGFVFLAEGQEIDIENVVKSESTFDLDNLNLNNLCTKQQI